MSYEPTYRFHAGGARQPMGRDMHDCFGIVYFRPCLINGIKCYYTQSTYGYGESLLQQQQYGNRYPVPAGKSMHGTGRESVSVCSRLFGCSGNARRLTSHTRLDDSNVPPVWIYQFNSVVLSSSVVCRTGGLGGLGSSQQIRQDLPGVSGATANK